MVVLNTYIQNILESKRTDYYDHTINIWTLGTGSGWASDDAYREVTYDCTVTPFSGSVAYNPWQGHIGGTGGYHETADIVLTGSDSYKTTISAERAKIQLFSGAGTVGTFYYLDRIVDCPSTNEIVVYATKMGEQ